MRSPLLAPLIAVAIGELGNCSRNVPVGEDFPRANPGGNAAARAAGAGVAGAGYGGAGDGGNSGGASGAEICADRTCEGRIYACGDCEDNDQDGAVDAADPGCTGPCDDTEDVFAGMLPGQNHAPCRHDCYFDADSGDGNDGCRWTLACDPLEPAGDECPYDPAAGIGAESCSELVAAGVSAQCLDTCQRLTPNGCDCFGCCRVGTLGRPVWIGAEGCSPETLEDSALCPPCTQVEGCLNPCEQCELCVGKVALPPECLDSGGEAPGSQQCPESFPPCGLLGQEPCDRVSYCVTGCCVVVPW